MKYEHIPVPKRSKIKWVSALFLIGGIIVTLVGGISLIPYRSIVQIGGIVLLAVSIMIMAKYATKGYRYRIEDLGEGDEFLVDELTRTSNVTVCRLELSKLISVKAWKDCDKELRSKKRYSYCPDILGEGTYLLEFEGSGYDNTDKIIRIRLTPDERLVSIFTEWVAKNSGNIE